MPKPLQIIFRPRFDACLPVTSSAHSEFPAIVRSWQQAMPESPVDDLDFEDWVENAVQLHHAMKEAKARPGEVAIFIEEGSGKAANYRAVSINGEPVVGDFDASRPFLLIGLEGSAFDGLRQSPMVTAPSRNDQVAASTYYTNPGFWTHARRNMQLATYGDGEGDVEPGTGLMDVLAARRDLGQASAFVKVNDLKAGFASIELVGRSDEQIQNQLSEAFEWTLVRMAGRHAGFLVQDEVKMEHEYRVFVVDGVAVAGAGCIAEHTPLNNLLPRFDSQTRRTKPLHGVDAEPVASHHDVVDRYEHAIDGIVTDLIAGNPRMRDFVVDLCLIDNEVAVVEVNPSRNAGLYALDVSALTKARVERGLRQVAAFEADQDSWTAPDADSKRLTRLRP